MWFLVLSLLLIAGGGSFAINIVPINYDLQFNTDIHNGAESYDGTVEICFNVTEEVGKFELQARNLTIKDVTLSNKEEVHKMQWSKLPNGNLRVEPDQHLPTGNYHLKVTFSGAASENDVMFKGSYQRDGQSVDYLMSKPTKSDFNEMPSAFPNFGEHLKATFKISVVHHESFRAWSNMPLLSPPTPHDREHYVTSSFHLTPEMHVFDVGFFVADFESKQFGALTVVARKEVLESVEYVGSVCGEFVSIMDNYTAVDYDGDVADYALIVVPRKLSNSNLTEFGRKFVEEQNMVYNNEKDDFNALAKGLKTAGYNVMLQWFGNLVAPEEDRLLQAFSIGYTYFNAEKVYEHEYMVIHYQVDVVQESLLRDYERPSSVLNMFWLIVLDTKWSAVMKNLMKNRKPRTLTAAQLCSEAEALWKDDFNLPEGTTLEVIFSQWMLSDEDPPVLNVDRLYSNGKVDLVQDGSEKILPYNFATKSSHFDQLGPFQWLTSGNETIQLDVSDDHWVVFNKFQFGFYRVNYDERNWRLIVQALHSNFSSIERVSRIQLLYDALYFVKNDQLDVSILLEMLTYLHNETDHDVWYDAYKILETWYYPEMDPPKFLKEYFVYLIEPYYQSFASHDVNESTHRMELHTQSEIAGLACWLGVKDCLDRARSRFQQAVAKDAPIEPNWSWVHYCYGLQNASDEELEWLLAKYSERLSRSVGFLSCVDNEKHLRRVLVELKTKADLESIAALAVDLDEGEFEMLHSLFKNDPDLVQVLGSSTIEYALERVSKNTRSAQTLQLIDDLEATLGLHIAGKGSGCPEKNIWVKPEAAEFIERYMAKLKDSH